MNELKVLLIEGENPCERSENKFLDKLIECPTERNQCMQCIWEKQSDNHPRVLGLIHIIELE